MATETIDELVALLGFELEDDEAIKKFNKELGDATKVLGTVVKVATAAAAAIGVFVTTTTAELDELKKFTELVGENSDAVQEWEFAVGQAGGTVGGLRSSLTNLNQIISEASRGQGAGVEVFGLLGIQIRNAEGQLRKGSDLLSDVSDRMQTLSAQERVEFGRKLGLDEGMINVLDEGSAKIDQLRERARLLNLVVSKEGLKASEEFRDSWHELRSVFKGVTNEVAVGLAPQFRELVDLVIEWFVANRELISQGIGTVMEVTVKIITRMVSEVRRLVNILGRFVFDVVGLGRAMKILNAAIALYVSFKLGRILIATAAAFRVLAAAMTLANIQALLIPLLLGALVLGLGLLAEDAWTAMQGGESVIGDFLNMITEKAPGVTAALDGIFGFIDLVIQGWKTLIDELTNFDFDEAISNLANNVKFTFSKENIISLLTGAAKSNNTVSGQSSPSSISSTSSSSKTVINDNSTVKVEAKVAVSSAGDAERAGKKFGEGLNSVVSQSRKNAQSSREY